MPSETASIFSNILQSFGRTPLVRLQRVAGAAPLVNVVVPPDSGGYLGSVLFEEMFDATGEPR